MEIGEIEFSKSRQLHPVVSKRDPSLDLKTKDIDGAWAGTHSEKFLRRNVMIFPFWKNNNKKFLIKIGKETLHPNIESWWHSRCSGFHFEKGDHHKQKT